jgi:hypothetical protein
LPLTVLAVDRGGTLGDVFTAALGVVLVFIVLPGLTWLTAVLFNRPRFAASPHLHDRASVFGARAAE